MPPFNQKLQARRSCGQSSLGTGSLDYDFLPYQDVLTQYRLPKMTTPSKPIPRATFTHQYKSNSTGALPNAKTSIGGNPTAWTASVPLKLPARSNLGLPQLSHAWNNSRGYLVTAYARNRPSFFKGSTSSSSPPLKKYDGILPPQTAKTMPDLPGTDGNNWTLGTKTSGNFDYKAGSAAQGPFSREFKVTVIAPRNWRRMKWGQRPKTIST